MRAARAPARFGVWIIGAMLGLLGSPAQAQPTYKLDVKDYLQPRATLRLDGVRLQRSAVRDDPGFRLQYHFRKAGQTVATVEARSHPSQEIPQKEAGTYTVVLELFYPAYKGGTQQKGEFRPVSNALTYTVYLAPGRPARVVNTGELSRYLFYGLSSAKQLPVPEAIPSPSRK